MLNIIIGYFYFLLFFSFDRKRLKVFDRTHIAIKMYGPNICVLEGSEMAQRLSPVARDQFRPGALRGLRIFPSPQKTSTSKFKLKKKCYL